MVGLSINLFCAKTKTKSTGTKYVKKFFLLGYQDEIQRIRLEHALEKIRVLDRVVETKEKEIAELKEEVQRYQADADIVSMMLSSLISDLDGKEASWYADESNLVKINKMQSIISNLLNDRENAEDVAKSKASFLANMSHEIRTPMNGIMGITKLLLNTDLTEKQKEYLNAVESSSDTLLVIINDILDVSKIQAGKLSIEKKSFRLSEVLNSVYNVFEVKAAEKRIFFRKSFLESDLPTAIIGDAVRLNQILYNLIGNAIKFTTEGGVDFSVQMIKSTPQECTIEFRIKDTGIGISAGQKSKIFQPFAQANDNTSRKFGGTGLGLTIVKQLIDLQNGELFLDSVEGEGSTFSFRLTYEIDVHLKTTEGLTDQYFDFSGLKILLVEDNPVNQLVATDFLLEKQGNITLAENGEVALLKLEQENFDLVLMDMQMPIMDGYEAMLEIKKDPKKYGNMPIVALTAHTSQEEIDRCLQAGASAFLSKPFSPQALYEKVNENRKGILAHSLRSLEVNPPLSNCFDYQFLLDYVGGNEKLAAKILTKISTEIPLSIDELSWGVRAEDWVQIGAAAHKLKPNVQMIGNSELYKLLQTLEQDAKSEENLTSFSKRIDFLVAELERLLKEIQKVI